MEAAQRRRAIAGLFVVRCLTSAAGSFVMISSGELLLRVFDGDTAKSQRVMTALGTASIVMSFLTGPLSGALIDAWGRRACVCASLLCAGLLRIWVSWRRPSVFRYVAYRVALSVLTQSLFPAMRAALADIVPRAGDDYTRISSRMANAETAVRVLGLVAVGRLASPQTGMLVAATCSLTAAAAAMLCMRETLAPERRRPVDWKVLRNPLSSVAVLRRSRPLSRLALVHVLMSVPANNGCFGMFRRARFGPSWGMADESWLSVQGELCR